MNIFSKRDKNGRFQGGKESESVIEDESKTVSAPSESVSTDDSTNTITIPETKMRELSLTKCLVRMVLQGRILFRRFKVTK
jgi:hypothetical protein